MDTVLEGKGVRLAKHIPENLDKMFRWSTDKDLIDREAGNIHKISENKETYLAEVFSELLALAPCPENRYCHFAIYTKKNNALVGYADLLPTGSDPSKAELSLSIPETPTRNLGYGIEAFYLACQYGFEIAQWENIEIRTRVENLPVIKIFNKVHLHYKIENTPLHGKTYPIATVNISKKDWESPGKTNNARALISHFRQS